MARTEDGADWKRLIELLEPVHDSALQTARRLSRSSVEGDDLLQESVLRAYHRISGLRDPGSFRTWFYRILLSVHANRSRRSLWRRFLSLEDLGPQEREGPVGQDGAILAEERRQAERASRALATLPAVQREAIVLHDVDGFTVEEIASMQKVSVSAVKSRLVRGRERLRRHYERIGWSRGADRIAAQRESVLPESGTP